MKEIKLYECDLCKRQYETPEQATGCENGHAKIVGVVGSRYGDLFPKYITIRFDNGKKTRVYAYRRLDG